MKNQKQSKFTLTKRFQSLNTKAKRSQSKNSFTKQNDHSDISVISKYFHPQEKEEYHPDQTDRFLAQTKNKLYSSSQKLYQFHKNKLSYQFNAKNNNFNILNKQLKSTKQKILTKHFLKSTKSTNSTSRNQLQSQRLENYGLNKKIVLIQKTLPQNKALIFKTELIKKVSELQNQYCENEAMRDKIVIYFINHQIISKYLQETAKDTRKISLKKENINLYTKMKDEMISILSNQQHFLNHIGEIKHQQQTRINSLLKRTPQNQQKLIKINPKPKFSANYEMPLLQKIQDLLEISKNSIKDAFVNFGQSPKSHQIQLQFNKKLNNNFVLQ